MLSEASVERRLATPRVQVLCMHHVFDDEIAEFESLLESLASTHDLLTVSAAFERLRSHSPNHSLNQTPLTRPVLCFTFDDGFLHHVRVGAMLERVGGRATFFPCTQPLDADDASRDEFCVRRLRRPPIAMMGWRDLEALVHAGHEIGCHTATHRDLAHVPIHELDDEIAGSAAALRRRLGTIRAFAWPFGRREHLSEAARAKVLAAGFDVVLSAMPGSHRHGPAPTPAFGPAWRVMAEPVMGARLIRRLLAMAVEPGQTAPW